MRGARRGGRRAVEEWREEYFGVDAFGGPTVAGPTTRDPPEVIGRLAWRAADRRDAPARWAARSACSACPGPPTIAGTGRGRDGKPTQLLAVTPFAVDRDLVDAQVRVELTT